MEVSMNTITKIVMMALLGLSVVSQADVSAAGRTRAGRAYGLAAVAAPVAPVRHNLDFDADQVAREEALRQAEEQAEFEDACAEDRETVRAQRDMANTNQWIADNKAAIAKGGRNAAGRSTRTRTTTGYVKKGCWDRTAARWNSLPTVRGALSAVWSRVPSLRGTVQTVRNNPGRSALVATSVVSGTVAAPVLAGVVAGTQASVALGLTATAVSGVSGYVAYKKSK